MLNSNLVKNILSLLVIAGVIYLSFRYVTRPFSELDPVTGIAVSSSDTVTSSADTENLANVFADLLEKLATVDFQKGNPIFNNPIFQNGLVSFSRELPEIDKARVNPFAPIEGNPALYIRYSSPAPTPLTFSTSSSAFPVGISSTTKATTTKK